MDDDSVVTAFEALCADNTNADLCAVLTQINANAASMGTGVDTFYLLFAVRFSLYVIPILLLSAATV